MCLGIPGKIKEIYTVETTRMGKVDFSGVELDVCLEATPEAEINDYVIVHAGFAISRLNEEEANETLSLLKEIEEINQQEVLSKD
jgi:hydrogenase expression/formation protein HypC